MVIVDDHLTLLVLAGVVSVADLDDFAVETARMQRERRLNLLAAETLGAASPTEPRSE